MKTANPENRITYKCENKNCNVMVTKFKSRYAAGKTHACSRKCSIRLTLLDKQKEPPLISVKTRIDEYFKNKELK